MNKIKIAIVIPCWKRSIVLEYVMNQFDLLYQKTPNYVDVMVIYVFSKNDPELPQMLFNYLKSNHQRDYIYSANEFLGQKLNDGIWLALNYNFDYVMNCGSDDLIHPKLFDLYKKHLLNKELLFGINKLYFYKDDQDPLFFSGYNKPYVVGAGRMIHKSILMHVFSEYGGLYSKDINRGMDTMSSNRMHEIGYVEKTVNPGKFPYVIDIKSNININSFQKINRSGNATKHIVPADRYYLFRHFKILQEYEFQITNLSAKKVFS
ncbi:MAG: glycosyltransferase family A protein [Paludibacter sp.]|nr:glycosyltransferase family A protein [Paludibacter sp.]